MPTTPRRKLRYPLESDTPDVPRDLQNLATDADAEDPGLPPIGSEMEYAGENDPNANWMVEDGREISRATYATLFARLGTKWGAGNGVNTFNLPDTRGRVSVGAGTGAGLTNRTIASKFGEENHKLTVAESPAHFHTTAFARTEVGPHEGGAVIVRDNFVEFKEDQVATNSVGGDGAHNNMQPSVAKTKIIRVL